MKPSGSISAVTPFIALACLGVSYLSLLIVQLPRLPLMSGQHTVSGKCQRVNILSFVGQWVSGVTAQLGHCRTQHRTQVRVRGCVPRKLCTEIGSRPDLAHRLWFASPVLGRSFFPFFPPCSLSLPPFLAVFLFLCPFFSTSSEFFLTFVLASPHSK